MSCRIAAQLVGDEPAGETALFLEQFPKESDSGTPVPSRLDEDVEPLCYLHLNRTMPIAGLMAPVTLSASGPPALLG